MTFDDIYRGFIALDQNAQIDLVKAWIKRDKINLADIDPAPVLFRTSGDVEIPNYLKPQAE